jgi:hypothetical protein
MSHVPQAVLPFGERAVVILESDVAEILGLAVKPVRYARIADREIDRQAAGSEIPKVRSVQP